MPNIYNFIEISDIVVGMKSLKLEIEKYALRFVDEFTMQNYNIYD